MRLACACGCTDLLSFGPYKGDREADDLGLVWVLTCTQCGEQLRIYQTSPAWRAVAAARGHIATEQVQLCEPVKS